MKSLERREKYDIQNKLAPKYNGCENVYSSGVFISICFHNEYVMYHNIFNGKHDAYIRNRNRLEAQMIRDNKK